MSDSVVDDNPDFIIEETPGETVETQVIETQEIEVDGETIIQDTAAIQTLEVPSDTIVITEKDTEILEVGTQGPQGIQGDTGPQGPQGDPGTSVPVIVDTRDNILALSPTLNSIAVASDTGRVYFGDGTNWQESPIIYKPRPQNSRDMGFEKNSPLSGYGETFFTDKIAYNFRILGNVLNAKGAIKIAEDVNGIQSLQIFINGAYQDLPADITFVDTDGNYVHSINNQQIEIMSGNSVDLGINGLPTIQQYKRSMGAFPFPIVSDGNIP